MKLETCMTHPFSYLSVLLLFSLYLLMSLPSCCPVALALPLKSGSLSAPSAPVTLEIPVSAAVERPRGLGRWSPMQEVQSLIPRQGYIPQVTAEIQWHGVTLPHL